MKLERNRAGNKYTFTPEDEKDEKFLDRIGKLEEENKNLKEELEKWKYGNSLAFDDIERICNEKLQLKEENRKLNEFKEKREESKSYFKAQMERAEPKTAREAEDLQRAKKLFEKLYREELSCLEEENKKLKEERDMLIEDLSSDKELQQQIAQKQIDYYEENKKLKDEIEHLEFDIEAWKKLKAVWEKKEQELQRENDKLEIHIEAKDKAYMDLLTDYNYLKARIAKMEKAYLKFHEDLKKLDDKLDNDIMNR